MTMVVYQPVPFRRNFMAKRPINSIKNVVDTSGAIVALTNTVLQNIIQGEDTTIRAGQVFAVERGGVVKGFFLSLFFASDVNQAASAVPLLDWYCIVDKGGILNSSPTFGNGAGDYPIPGGTGTAVNVNKIIHEEKGLIGEKNDGSKMVFQGVIKIPRGMQRINIEDRITIIARANDEAIFCLKCIYKWYK